MSPLERNICRLDQPLIQFRIGRPHLNESDNNENVFCMCDKCDAKLESELKGQHLNDLCDCDVPRLWRCFRCVEEEEVETRQMYERNTLWEEDPRLDEHDETKWMTSHQHAIFVCIVLHLTFASYR